MQYQSQGIKIFHGKQKNKKKTHRINKLLTTKSNNILIAWKFLLFYQFTDNANLLIALINTDKKIELLQIIN